jgi:hypothetical protein
MKKNVALYSNLRSGFLLVELLIYFCLVTLFVFLVMNWLIWLHKGTTNMQAKNIFLMNSSATIDTLIRYIKQAPSAVSDWRKINKHEYVWLYNKDEEGNTYAQGWGLEGRKLFFYQGLFDFSKNVWLKKTKNIISQECSRFSLHICKSKIREECIDYITYNLTLCKKNFKSNVFLRNRIYFA